MTADNYQCKVSSHLENKFNFYAFFGFLIENVRLFDMKIEAEFKTCMSLVKAYAAK